MKKFLIKLLLFTSPALLVLGLYLYKDPFKVLYSYDCYYGPEDSLALYINRDVASFETFKNNCPKYNYDSYIFGNSRGAIYPANLWGDKIDSRKVFHFDAFNESLYGLSKKLEYMGRNDIEIKNALFVIDYDLLKKANNNTGVTRTHYRLSGESYFSFQAAHLKDYFRIKFLKSYLKALLTRKPLEITFGIMHNRCMSYHLPSNELITDGWERLIHADEAAYYRRHSSFFAHQDTGSKQLPLLFGESHVKLLKNIKSELDRNNTSFKLVISPLYDQKSLDSRDLATLNSIFGAGNIYDFSGVNAITANRENYYERSHYRTHVAVHIINSIYGDVNNRELR